MPFQSKYWCFTLNNYNPVYEIIYDSTTMDYLVYGREVGAQNTPHLQGYVEFKKVQRMTSVKRLLGEDRIHLEGRMGTCEEAIDYCKKDNNWIDYGEHKCTVPGQRTEIGKAITLFLEGKSESEVSECIGYSWVRSRGHILAHVRQVEADRHRLLAAESYNNVVLRDWQQELLEVLSGDPHPRQVIWYYDADGNAGKTFMSKYLVHKHNAARYDNAKSVDVKYAYTGQRICVFDLVRSCSDHINYEIIEQIKNGIFFSTKYISQCKTFMVPHVVCFSNEMPDQTKLSADRWNIIDLVNYN